MSTQDHILQYVHKFEDAQVELSALTWAHFLNDVYINYLPAILPVLLGQLNIPIALVGSLILALQGLGSILQPFIGRQADRIGGHQFILVGLSLSAIGASFIGLAPSYWVLIALLIVAGLGNAIFHPQALASARSVSHNQAGLKMSVFLVGGELGRGIWPSVAGLLVMWLGLNSLWIFALPGALTILLLNRFTPQLEPEAPKQVQTAWSSQRGPILSLISFVGLRGMVMFGVITFVPLIWHDHGGSLIGGASLISVMLVVGILGNLTGGALADRIGRRPILIGSSILSAGFLLMYLYANGLWLWISLGLLGVAVFSTAPVTMLIGQDLFPQSRSMGSGIALGVGNALGAVAVFALGFVASSYGVEAPLWWLVGFALLGLPFAFLLPEHQEKEQG
jgi:FSR family fosmidomycin resistance protein-like MFS transporter